MPRKYSTYIVLSLIYFLFLGGIMMIVGQDSTLLKLAYLENKMFKVKFDLTFYITLILYLVFIISMFVYFSWRLKKLKLTELTWIKRGNRVSVFLGFLTIFASIFIFRSFFQDFMTNGGSLYLATRFADPVTLKFFQILIRLSLAFSFLSFAYSKTGLDRVLSIFLIAVIIGVCLLVGNRMELLIYAIAVFFYFIYACNLRLKTWKTVVVVFGALVVFNIIESSRYLFTVEIETFSIYDILLDFVNVFNMLTSTETVASFISLYGILYHDVRLTIFEVLNVLSFSSFDLPNAFDSYHYYSNKLNLLEGQGYSFNILSCFVMLFGPIIGVFSAIFFVIGVFELLYEFICNLLKYNGFIMSYFLSINLLWGRMTYESSKVVLTEGILIPLFAFFIVKTIAKF